MNRRDYLTKESIDRVKKNVKHEEELLKFIEEEYKRAINKINRDITYYLDRIAESNKLSMNEAKKLLNSDELKDFRMSLKEYIKKGKGVLDEATIKELENASNRVHISRLQAMEYEIKKVTSELLRAYEKGTKELLIATYQDSFYRTLFDLQSIANEYEHISAMDIRRIEALFTEEWSVDRVSLNKRFIKNQNKLNEELRRQLYQSIVGTQSTREAIANLSDRMNISKRSASLLVSTENGAIASFADRDAYKEYGVKQYEILATLDQRTTRICREMDGKVFPVGAYEVGLTASPFHPRCRTTSIPYFSDEEDERVARDIDDNEIKVSSKVKYEEWYKEYIN